jgi:NO-binding membrane sensor protein with MHYT domain
MVIAVLLGVAAFLCLMLAPSSVDDALAAAREKFRRYRSGALICFSIAVLTYTVVATVALSTPVSNRLASFGVAWWLVGCALVPFAAYYAWRTAQLDSDPYE